MNLIPKQNKNSPSYWCSWQAQNIMAVIVGDAAKGARDMLDEALIFGESGYVHQYGDVRGDLYFLLDDGWDVDYDVNPNQDPACFGSLIMSEKRFPSVQGLPPAQRLGVINRMVKSHGWKGLGLWVAAQRCAEDYQAPFSERDLAYWRERILWCRDAGVEYWKVDWGAHADHNAFRKALTEMAGQLYPALIIEHATCMLPLNAYEHADPALQGRYAGEDSVNALAKDAVTFSQVFRSYDVLGALSIPTTLDRLATLLPIAKGYVNGEDECYISAALGCTVGVMRSHYYTDKIREVGDDRTWRLDEVTAALHWQRIAPPFIGTQTACSEDILFDEQYFDHGSTWYGDVFGKHVRQGAPARIARNLCVNSVWAEGEVKPYVVASLHPNGAYCVSVQPRRINGARHYPGACVHCNVPSGVDTVGLLGVGCDIVLHLPAVPQKVYVQGLLGDQAVELPPEMQGSEIRITKEYAGRVFGAADLTAPALVLRMAWDDSLPQ